MSAAAEPGRVWVVSRPESARGFRLAGLPALTAVDPPAAGAAVRRLADEPDTAVVFVQRTLFDGLGEGLRRSLESRPVPVVVPFPDPAWAEPEAPEEWVVELLRRAVGYRVQLR